LPAADDRDVGKGPHCALITDAIVARAVPFLDAGSGPGFREVEKSRD
jgi:hypothetical protein